MQLVASSALIGDAFAKEHQFVGQLCLAEYLSRRYEYRHMDDVACNPPKPSRRDGLAIGCLRSHCWNLLFANNER
jgi:hypothetical protein